LLVLLDLEGVSKRHAGPNDRDSLNYWLWNVGPDSWVWYQCEFHSDGWIGNFCLCFEYIISESQNIVHFRNLGCWLFLNFITLVVSDARVVVISESQSIAHLW